MGAEQGLAAAVAIEQLGKKDKIVNGSLGLSVNALQALRDGEILLIADLQPYVDGHYFVVLIRARSPLAFGAGRRAASKSYRSWPAASRSKMSLASSPILAKMTRPCRLPAG
jgi:hypothetical protein